MDTDDCIMKKLFTFLLITLMAVLMCSCSLTKRVADYVTDPNVKTEPIVTGEERGYIIYNNKTFYDIPFEKDLGANFATYKDVWTPLSNVTHNANAQYKSTLGESTVTINVFDDKDLSMFIVYEDFNGKWLYCDQYYSLPDYLKEYPVEICVSTDELTNESNDENIVIIDSEKIISVINELRQTSKHDVKAAENDSELVPDAKAYNINFKFNGVNAYYYFGNLLQTKNGYSVGCQDSAGNAVNMPVSEKVADILLNK